MNNIVYDDKIITPEDHKWDYYCNFLNRLNKRDCVKFALFCAKIVANNSKENNACIELVEKWLKDEHSVSIKELRDAAYFADSSVAYYASYASYYAADAVWGAAYAAYAAYYSVNANIAVTDKINKYLQILIRKTKQFQNNKILEQISKTDVDKLELVDWNMITDIMQEEYDIIHEFDYEDIFSRRCLIELLRREYT